MLIALYKLNSKTWEWKMKQKLLKLWVSNLRRSYPIQSLSQSTSEKQKQQKTYGKKHSIAGSGWRYKHYSTKHVTVKSTSTEFTPWSTSEISMCLPWNNQNHISSDEELGFHPIKYFPTSGPGDILASWRGTWNIRLMRQA
jgi:hypothetical protein